MGFTTPAPPPLAAEFDTVTVRLAEVAVLPAASRATAVITALPLAEVMVFQAIENGGVVTSAPRLAPFSLNCTPATPALSLALAVMVTVPLTVAPAAGAVRDTVGLVVSAGGGGGGGVPPVSTPRTCVGTLTMNASSRLPAVLLVQMKYCPVTSRLPLGDFA